MAFDSGIAVSVWASRCQCTIVLAVADIDPGRIESLLGMGKRLSDALADAAGLGGR